MKKVDLFLVRHGQSEENVVYNAVIRAIRDGDPDELRVAERRLRALPHTSRIPLTELGVEQAKMAGAVLRKVIQENDSLPLRLHTSPYARALQTVVNLGLPKSNDWFVRHDLSERSWGRMSKLSFREFDSYFKELEDDPYFASLPGGASLHETSLRLRPLVKRLLRDEGMVIVVAHGDVIRVMRMIIEEWSVGEIENNLADSSERILNGQVLNYKFEDGVPVSFRRSDEGGNWGMPVNLVGLGRSKRYSEDELCAMIDERLRS